MAGQFIGVDDTRPLEIRSVSDFASIEDAAAWLASPTTDTEEVR
jgi:hypothetical protein